MALPLRVLRCVFGWIVVALLAFAAGPSAAAEPGTLLRPHEVLATLSAEERIWIANHPILRVVGLRDAPPIYSIPRSGEIAGHTAAVAELSERRTGLRFLPSAEPTIDAALARAERGEAEMVLNIGPTKERDADLIYSHPYARGQTAFVEVVDKGKAEAAIGNLEVIVRFTQAHFADRLLVSTTVPGGESELYPGVRTDRPELPSILRKDLASITEGDHAQIPQKRLAIRDEQAAPWTTIIAYGISLGAVAIVIALWFAWRARKRTGERISALTDLYAALGEANETIAREYRIDALIQHICQIAVVRGGLSCAWAGLLDEATGSGREVGFFSRTARADGTPSGHPFGGRWPSIGATGRAVLRGTISVNNDLIGNPSRPEHREHWSRLGLRASAAFPFKVHGRVAGGMAVYADRAGYFNGPRVQLLERLAAGISFALQRDEIDRGRQTALAALEQANRELLTASNLTAALSEANREIARGTDTTRLLDAICRIAVERCGLAFAWVRLYDTKSQTTRTIAWSGRPLADGSGRWTPTREALEPVRSGSFVEALATGKRVVVSDFTTCIYRDEPIVRSLVASGFRSGAAFPLGIRGRIVGALAVYHEGVGYLTEDRQQLLDELASGVAFALDRDDLEQGRQLAHDQLEQANKELVAASNFSATLSEANRTIAHTMAAPPLMREICRLAVERIGLACAWVCLYERTSGRVQTLGFHGRPRVGVAGGWALPDAVMNGQLPSSVWIPDLLAGKAVIANDFQHERFANDPHAQSLYRNGFRSSAAFPFLVRRRGGTFAIYSDEVEFFTEERQRLLKELVAGIAFAIERDARESALARLTRLKDAISQANHLIARTVDRAHLLSQICRLAVDHGGLSFAWVALARGEDQPIRSVAAHGRTLLDQPGDWTLPDGTARGQPSAFVRRELLAGRRVVDNDFATSKLLDDPIAELERQGFSSGAVLPLFVGSKVIGGFCVYADEPGFFDEERLELLEELAKGIAFSIERDRLERDRTGALDALEVAHGNLRVVSDLYAALSETNRIIAQTSERTRYLSRICRIAVERGGLAFAWVALPYPSSEKLRNAGSYGRQLAPDLALWNPPSRPEDPDPSGPLIERARSGRRAHDNDLSNSATPIGYREPLIAHGFHSLGLFPLHVGGRTAGVFAVYSEHVDFFNEERLGLLEELASSISFALERDALEADRSRARTDLEAANRDLKLLSSRLLEAQETERRAIAQELHDELGQTLNAVKLSLHRLERKGADDRAVPLEDAIVTTDLAIQQVRSMHGALRPPQLDDLGLVAALRTMAERQARSGGLDLDFRADEAIGRKPTSIETACYRIAQEAVTNTVRHANASLLRLSLAQTSAELVLEVSDDGDGFVADRAVAAARHGSIGIVGMRERAQLVGADLSIDSEPGHGTRLVARFPLELRAESDIAA